MAKKATKDSKGRFAKGNPGGPGRPPAPVERAYLKAAVAAVDEDRFVKAVQAIAGKAEKGDIRAFALLVDLLVGRGEIEARITALEARLFGQDKPGQ